VQLGGRSTFSVAGVLPLKKAGGGLGGAGAGAGEGGAMR
jgi:hypothetical protein